MGRKQDEQEQEQKQQQQSKSLRSKAVHFVSDITTVILNPISDKPSAPPPKPSSHDGLNNSLNSQSDVEEDSKGSVDGPDTSSFSAFLYSFLSSSGHENHSEERSDTHEGELKQPTEPIVIKESSRKKSLFSRGKHTLGKAFYQAAKIGGFRNLGPKGKPDTSGGNGSDTRNEGISMQTLNESVSVISSENLPETSEPSVLLSEKIRSVLYAALPVIVQGRKWMLLYSTWRHGISLSTLYRRSMIWPGLSLLVVGDRNGAIFGGLVDAPLRPSSKRRYQYTYPNLDLDLRCFFNPCKNVSGTADAFAKYSWPTIRKYETIGWKIEILSLWMGCSQAAGRYGRHRSSLRNLISNL
ncbi:TLD-domain containing nucleolar protein [Striga hermonthica]|uniref:Oxidation resistance protein 1 n=1 Tax=Striga hermonthica TaxID=68872 RepID=A0A9N7RNB7_STRHE|nr:TLD-domain containing nucleolar protein [Striga hermonthica]